MKKIRCAMPYFLFKIRHGNGKTFSRIFNYVSYVVVALLAVAAVVPFSPAPLNAANADRTATSPSGGSTRFEWFHAVQDSTEIGYHGVQTFTPANSHVVKQIKLKLWNTSFFPVGILTIGIAATDVHGMPTGDFLASGNIATSLIGDHWTTVSVDLGSGCQVYAGTMYAIRIDSPVYSIYAMVDINGAAYSGGYYLSAGKKMTFWVDHRQEYDIWFEEWGVSSGTIPPSVITDNATDIGTTFATLRGNLVSTGSAANITLGFEFGATTNYGKFIPSQASANGTFTAKVSDLLPNTLYHFRAAASGYTAGSNYGADFTFNTSSGPLDCFQSYLANQDNTGIGYHAAQTFTPQISHIVKQIKLKLLNYRNLLAGNLTVGITATDAGGIPDREFLASGTVAGTSIGSDWTIVTIDLGNGCQVDAGMLYAIRIDSPDPDAIYAQVDITGASYAGGNYLSADQNTTLWVDYNGMYDIWFEEWGILPPEVIFVTLPVIPAPLTMIR